MFDADQFFIQALSWKRKSRGIKPNEVKKGGVEVAKVDLLAGKGAVAHFIGFAVSDTWPDPGAGHPKSKGVGIVISAGEGHFRTVSILLHRGSAEFSAPDDEGVVKHSPLFEVGEQSGDRH